MSLPKKYMFSQKPIKQVMAVLLGARTLLGAPGHTTGRKLIGAPGLTTRSKDATRGSWPYYWEQGRYRNLGLQAIFTEAARTSLEAAWHSEFLSKKG